MQGFDDLQKWLRKQDDFWIINGAEEFLNSGQSGKKADIVIHEDLFRVGTRDEIDAVARDEGWFLCFYAGANDGLGCDGIFGKITGK